MSRYLVGGILILVALTTLYGVGGSEGIIAQINNSTRTSRRTVSANPANAQELTPLERAGQNVERQGEAMSADAGDAPGADPATTPEETPSPAETAEPSPPPSPSPSPSPTQPPPQEPIPALW